MAHHIKIKKLLLNQRRRNLQFVINKESNIYIQNKLNLYTSLLMPIWSYGIQVYRSAKTIKYRKNQSFPNNPASPDNGCTFLRLYTFRRSYYLSIPFPKTHRSFLSRFLFRLLSKFALIR